MFHAREKFGRTFHDFEQGAIAARFPEGFTIIHASGGWRDAATGETIREISTILEIAHDGGTEARRAVRAIAFAYKIIFDQDAVMVSTLPAAVEFI